MQSIAKIEIFTKFEIYLKKKIEKGQQRGWKGFEPGNFKVYVGGSSPMQRSFELGAPQMSNGTITLN